MDSFELCRTDSGDQTEKTWKRGQVNLHRLGKRFPKMFKHPLVFTIDFLFFPGRDIRGPFSVNIFRFFFPASYGFYLVNLSQKGCVIYVSFIL